MCNSIVTAKQYCKKHGFNELWVIGGQNIYEQCYFLKPDSYYLTIIDKHMKCDTFMPNLPKEYTLEETTLDQFKEPGDTKDTLLYFNLYTKKNPSRETTLLSVGSTGSTGSTGSVDDVQNT